VQCLQAPADAIACVSLEGTAKVNGVEVIHEWEARADLLESGPDDRQFVVEIDDERVAHLRFGDGDCGHEPDPGFDLSARYRVGNGTAGNVGAETIRQFVFRNNLPAGAQLSARNPFAATGGTAPESVGEAKLRIPFQFRTHLERAITADDYAAIVVRDFPAEVQRAAAVLLATNTGQEVLVAVDARGTEDPSTQLLTRIECHLGQYRRIGHDVRVAAAQLVSLALAMTVCVESGHLRGHVKAAVLAALSSLKLTGGRVGFFYPDNLTFGDGVYVSQIVAVVQAIEGVASVVVTQLERLYEGPNGELAAGMLPLGPMEVARLDNDPNFPEHGTLKLTLGGGR